MRVWKIYKRLLSKHPFGMQSLQTSILVGGGDMISQKIVESAEIPFDYGRSGKFFLLGSLMGPCIHSWYTFMEKHVGKAGIKVALTKVLLDQAVFAPIFLGVYMTTVTIMQGRSMKGIQRKIKNDYRDILIANYKVWPPVQVVNFLLVPLQFRVLIAQIVALGWNAYLSWKMHKKTRRELQKQKETK